MRGFFFFIGLLGSTLALAAVARAEKPVLAVAPVAAPGFPDAVTMTLNAKLVELARDSGAYAVFDQSDITTVLKMQKQGTSPVVADPIAYGRLVAARKVLTADLRRGGELCSLGLKISDVETGLVEAAKVEVGDCALPALLNRATVLWRRLTAVAVGTVRIAGAPVGAGVFLGATRLGAVPLTVDLPAGSHTLRIETDLAPALREVEVTPDRTLDVRVILPFAALDTFEKRFVAANKTGRNGAHEQAAELLDEALRAGLTAMTALPADLQPELAAALRYVEGARALTEAWRLQPAAQAGADPAAYCAALETAAREFRAAKAEAPENPQLGLSAVDLARRRKPLDLGVCGAGARFAQRVRELRWTATLDAGALRNQAGLNRALVYELKQQAGLSEEQRGWLAAEAAMLAMYEKLAAMAALKPELLKAPAATLPRFCELGNEVRGYAAAARKRFSGVRPAALPLLERLSALEAAERRVESESTLCP